MKKAIVISIEQVRLIFAANYWTNSLPKHISKTMECHDVETMLSAYFDAELATDQQISLDVHLENCSMCAAKLDEIRRLSQTASGFPNLLPPNELWKKLEDDLSSHTNLQSSASRRRWWLSPTALLTVAAILLVAIGFGFYFDHLNQQDYDHLANFWQKFETDPHQAQEQLLLQYSGYIVSNNQAVKQVGYVPLTSVQVPEAFTVEKTYMLELPCCKSIQTICRRADGTLLAVFEHNQEQPSWFLGCRSVQVQSSSATCCVTELNIHLAASWRVGSRMVTVIGLRDVEELSQWVRALDPTTIEH